MASVIVLMINGTADCGTAFSAMSRCREPKEIATTLAFLVAQPMNTGLRRSSDCGPSKYYNHEQVSEKVACTELHEPEARFVVACSGEARKIAKDFSAAWKQLHHKLFATIFGLDRQTPRVSLDAFSWFRSPETISLSLQ